MKKKKEESCWWKETLDTIITAVGLATIAWIGIQGREEAKKEAEEIAAIEENKIYETVSVAKVKILSLKLEDVIEF